MFRADSDDRWHWSADVSPALDFCVRALRHDVRRGPEVRHHPGPKARRSAVRRVA